MGIKNFLTYFSLTTVHQTKLPTYAKVYKSQGQIINHPGGKVNRRRLKRLKRKLLDKYSRGMWLDPEGGFLNAQERKFKPRFQVFRDKWNTWMSKQTRKGSLIESIRTLTVKQIYGEMF